MFDGRIVFNIWFANALQDRLTAARSNIVVNSLNPGFVLTNFLEKIPDVNMQNAMRGLANEKAYTAEEGGRFLLQAALEYADDSEKEKAFMGVFFDYGKVTEVSEFGRGEVGKKIQEKLWVSDSCYHPRFASLPAKRPARDGGRVEQGG